MNGLIFLETSAKEAKNIYEVFKVSAEKILNNILKSEENIGGYNGGNMKITQNGDKHENNNNNKKKGC